MATYAYGDHPHQIAELTLPAGEPPATGWPVAIVVHGGMWLTANGDLTRMVGLCDDLAARGWAAWNVEYRRLGGDSGGGWPQSAEDVAAATDHLATLENEPLDLSRVVSVGHSAGGHLTFLAAARSDARVPVTAAVGQAPVTDLLLAHGVGGQVAEVVGQFMGGTPEERPDEYRAASPAHIAPIGVPTLLAQGELDELVPPAMVSAYAEAAGSEAELQVFGGLGHFEHLDPASDAWQATAEWLERART